MMKLVVGCDGGGTKTAAVARWLHDDGSLAALGCGQAGPGNVLAGDSAEAIHNIRTALGIALRQAGVPGHVVADSLVLALAGAGRQQQRDLIHEQFKQDPLAKRMQIVPDYEAVLAAAESPPPAIVLIAGTGSVAWGRDEANNTFRSGGWGPLLGDEGSAYWIGLQAIRHAVRQLNRETPSLLTHAVLAHFAVRNLDELMACVYGPESDRSRVASLAAQVFSVKDPVAREVITTTAGHLADLVLDVARQMHATGGVDWILAGGMLVHQAPLQRLVQTRLTENGLVLPAPRIVPRPADGAVKMAETMLADT